MTKLKDNENAVKEPFSALGQLIFRYGYNLNDLHKYGYVNSTSAIYTASYRDVSKMKVSTAMVIGKFLHLSPGMVIDKVNDLQKIYPPKYK